MHIFLVPIQKQYSFLANFKEKEYQLRQKDIEQKRVFLGVKPDINYCKNSDKQKLLNPNILLKNYYFLKVIANRKDKKIVKNVILDEIGQELLPMSKQTRNGIFDKSQQYSLDTKISLIDFNQTIGQTKLQYGSEYLCNFQTQNSIIGYNALVGKDLFVDKILEYSNSEKFQNKAECQKTLQILPETYRLYITDECLNFFNYIQTQEYYQKYQNEGIQYILKFGTHNEKGTGIFLGTKDYLEFLLEKWKNGQECYSKRPHVILAQKYILNPLLYNGNKMELRLYYSVSSTNPLQIYVQKVPNIKICANKYDPKSEKKQVHVCNIAVSDKHDTNEKQDSNFSLDKLELYLKEKQIIDQNVNLAENILFPQIYRQVTHMVRANQNDFFQDSRVFHNFGADFLIDDNLKIWHLETNSFPELIAPSQWRIQRHKKQYLDLWEIQFGQLRSRFKRVQTWVNQFYQLIQQLLKNQQMKPSKHNISKIMDKQIIQHQKKVFQKINKNYFEKEFEPSKDNLYQKIYDENNKNSQFLNNLPDDCLFIN